MKKFVLLSENKNGVLVPVSLFRSVNDALQHAAKIGLDAGNLDVRSLEVQNG